MPACFEDAIEKGLAHEGGFVNNKYDPGGATNYGITLKVWAGKARSRTLTATLAQPT